MIDKDSLEDDLKNLDYELINLTRAAAYKNSDDNEDKLVNISIIGLNTDSDRFPEILEGEKIKKDDEVIASASLKDEEGLKIGDELKLSSNDKVFKIVGFTDDYKYSVSPVIYTKLKEASQSLALFGPNQGPQGEDLPEKVSAALIYGDKNINLDSDYDVVTINDFINKLPGYRAQILTFALMIGFLIVIAAIVLGVFLYIITIQKEQTFGIMKIQGISSGYIGKSVFIQTLLVSVIGLVIGLGLTYLTEQFLPVTMPFKSNPSFYALITLLIIITSQIGAIFSVRSVSKIDPLEVI